MLPLLLVATTLLAAAGSDSTGAPPPAPPGAAGLDDLAAALETAVDQEGYGAEEPAAEKAYEIFLRMQPTDVPDALLLGVILAGATKGSPLEVARALLAEAKDDLSILHMDSIIRATPGAGPATRARLLATSELYRRATVRERAKSKSLETVQDAVDYVLSLATGPYEKLVALYLNKRHKVIGSRLLTIGSAGFTIVDPAQVYAPALELGASAVIMAHQHPSGDPQPSTQDRDVTRRVVQAGQALGIPLLDHLVVTSSGKYTSLAETGGIYPGPSSIGFLQEP